MNKTLQSILTLFVLAPVAYVHAASTAPVVTSLDCSKKTLSSTVGKLDATVSNIVYISGSCVEDVSVSGFKDLTLAGVGTAMLTAGSDNALLVDGASHVTVQTLTVVGGGNSGILCRGRSVCVLSNVTVQGTADGVDLQDQSAVNILGSSSIQNLPGNGIGVFGASTVNVRPDPLVTGSEVGPVISGNGTGVLVQDGSFFRSDNTTFSGNGTGIFATRNATIKILSDVPGAPGGVVNNSGDGIFLRGGSTAQVGTTISGNPGAGIRVGELSFFGSQAGLAFSGNGQDVACTHVTAISQPAFYCGH